MFYVGLDIHSKRTSVCVLSGTGQVVRRCQVPQKAVYAPRFSGTVKAGKYAINPTTKIHILTSVRC